MIAKTTATATPIPTEIVRITRISITTTALAIVSGRIYTESTAKTTATAIATGRI